VRQRLRQTVYDNALLAASLPSSTMRNSSRIGRAEGRIPPRL